MDPTITDNAEAGRFEIRVDGTLAGIAEYRSRPGVRAFVHTEIDPDFEGQGLGSKLISAALDTARSEGDDVLPFCPFVNRFIETHAEYVDLVPQEMRARFGL